MIRRISYRVDPIGARSIVYKTFQRNNQTIDCKTIYFSKNDLDTDLFSINKRISIHNIDRYQEFNGNYLLYRKREVYIREDQNFKLNTMINMRRIDGNSGAS